MTDYDSRAATYDFASKEDIMATSQLATVVFLDVRTPQEVQVARFIPLAGAWVTCSCTAEAADELESEASTLLPDKEAPVIIYCGTGRRAVKAKEVLLAQGYRTVLNAGGLSDLGYLNV